MRTISISEDADDSRRPLEEPTDPSFWFRPDAAIDAMRVAAMLYIVGFWHLLDYATVKSWSHHNDITYRLTVLSLGLLVFISGFLAGGPYPGKSGEPNAAAYYRARFWRIYPPFLGASLLFMVLNIETVFALLKGVGFIAMFAEPAPRTLWFVSMLCVFYVVAPLFVRVREQAARFGLLCLSIIGAMLAYEEVTGAIDSRIVIYFPCFAAGIFFSARSLPASAPALVGLAILATATLLLTIGRPAKGIEYDLMSLPWAVCGSVAVFAAVKRLGRNLPSFGIIRYLSVASFFMYLLHRPIMKLLWQAWHPAGGSAQVCYAVFVGLPVIVLTAFVAQRAYDDWVVRVRRAAAGK